MRSTRRILIGLILGSVLISCSSSRKRDSGTTGSLGQDSKVGFNLRPYQEETLPNGLKILFVEDLSLPKVSISMLVKSGAFQDPSGLEGLNRLTVNLLDQGTSTKKAQNIADEFAQLGTSFHSTGGSDYSVVGTDGLSTTKEKLLELFVDVVLNPSFEAKEIDRKKQETLAYLQKLSDDPDGYADVKMNELIFEGHPYGVPSAGTKQSIEKIKRTDIIRHYFRFFRPNNSIISVAGQLTAEYKDSVKKAFSGWQYKEIEAVSKKPPEARKDSEILLLTKSGLRQSQIRFAQLGIRRSDPEYLKLRVASFVLGGDFASRLTKKVREELGLTYSISSHVDARRDVGSLEVSTFCRNEKLGEAIRATQGVLKEFRKGITRQELDDAKAMMIGQFPSAVETASSLGYNLMVLRFFGVPDTYLSEYIRNVEAISLSDVNQTIEKIIDLQRMQTLVYADEAAIQSQLKDLGPLKIKKVE